MRSAKAVKITDMDLIKRLGVIVGIFVLFLLIRTLVSPPVVIVGKIYFTNSMLRVTMCMIRCGLENPRSFFSRLRKVTGTWFF